ncbi:MAG: hypothetical protein NTX15_05475 [Candidatus Kapabacteria bacterium]|nr:hypothetical protein [Candidatus Kapabacteria bacterium]
MLSNEGPSNPSNPLGSWQSWVFLIVCTVTGTFMLGGLQDTFGFQITRGLGTTLLVGPIITTSMLLSRGLNASLKRWLLRYFAYSVSIGIAFFVLYSMPHNILKADAGSLVSAMVSLPAFITSIIVYQLMAEMPIWLSIWKEGTARQKVGIVALPVAMGFIMSGMSILHDFLNSFM